MADDDHDDQEEQPSPRDICPNCFAEVGGDTTCSACGFDLTTTKVEPTKGDAAAPA